MRHGFRRASQIWVSHWRWWSRLQSRVAVVATAALEALRWVRVVAVARAWAVVNAMAVARARARARARAVVRVVVRVVVRAVARVVARAVARAMARAVAV